MSVSQRPSRRVLVVVMDGIGHQENRFGNAVALAKTPCLEELRRESLFTLLNAHGTYVGLPSDSDIGNSEVGHNALGAGRIFDQGAKLVNQAIETGRLFEGDTWRDMIRHLKETGGTLHFLGLLSDGNVHSHEKHLHALLRRAKEEGLRRVRVHVLFDGRDVPAKSAETYVGRLEEVMASLRDANFDVDAASAGGRMRITMDRYEADWPMVARGWKTHVLGEGARYPSLSAGLAALREVEPSLTDQDLPPFVIDKGQGPIGRIVDGDAVVFYNFRGDRAIEISRAFTEENFTAFDRGPRPKVFYAGMMEYDGDLHIPPRYLVSPPEIDGTLSEYLLGFGARQFACSETQKYGHVTYFWNGNRSGYLDPSMETYVKIDSDEGITFDVRPEMKAKEITDATIAAMEAGSFDFGRINYANGDMVGHTGNLEAAVTAVEAVDREICRLMAAARATDTILLVTADHGNADSMFDGKESEFPDWDKGGPRPKAKTSHTLAPVPCYIFDPRGNPRRGIAAPKEAGLANVAATVIELMGLPPNPIYLPSILRDLG